MKRLAAIALALSGCVAAGGGSDDPGHRLFLAKCTSCHAAPEAARHTDGEWAGLVGEYAKEAKCTEEEIALILGYLRRVNGRE